MIPAEFFEFAKKHNAEMVDLKFTDLLGTWQHCTFPVDAWDEDTFVHGVGFDEVRYEQTQNRGYYEIDSGEGAWNTARFEEPNLGYKPSYKWENEVEALRLRPHPYEFFLYYDS